ncbi:M4 family metallopeptidase [Longispora sp. K20-0274]|uniref:M4 family metallopeptidase n=1 Tax=Longispora sp. K20-0274 TaxID=3088255 RepID=UPI00399A7292
MVPFDPKRAVKAGAGLVLVAGLLGLPAVTAAASTTPHASPALAVSDAQASLSSHGSALRASGSDAFTATGSTVDANGQRHVRFNRTFKGLPVLGGDVVVHSAANGQFSDASVGLQAPLNLSTSPKVTAQRAAELAAGGFAGQPASSTPALVVDATQESAALAWKVTVLGTASDNTPNRLTVLVDAQTGAIRNAEDTLRTFVARGKTKPGTATAVAPVAASGNGKGYQVGNVTIGVNSISGGYEMKDPNRGNGETRDANNKGDANGNTDPTVANSLSFTSTTTTFGDNTLNNRATVGVDAHFGIAATWDYYKNVLNRNGIKNDGVGVISYVHYYVNYGNAGWSDTCSCMIYGDGDVGSKPFTELDVAGHEMSHGVAAATAALGYSGDVGGINEANSDIFGTEVEFNANIPGDVPDYLIGEKIDINGNGTPLRYMDKPSKDGRGSVDCWTTSTKNLDPHYSSGVGNHWYFLMAQGSGASTVNGVSYNSPVCGTAPAVTGVGHTTGAKIWYRALSTYMTSTETYPMARKDTIKAANDLYGTGNGAECAAVKAAWLAVGVGVQTGEAACATGGTGTNTVTVTNPGNKTGTVGTAASLQISATDSASGATLTYSATGLPTGLSIASTTGLISGTPSAAGTYNVVVTVKDQTNASGTASFTWTISGTGGSCTAAQVVANGGFESGAASWTASSGVIDNGTSQPAHAGSYKAWLDGYGSAHTDTLTQSVTVPSGCSTYTLSFYLHIDTAESGSTAYDKLTVKAGTTTLATYSNVNAASGYVLKSFNLSAFAGQTVTLSFTGVEDSSLKTSFVIDDVALNVA